LHVDSLWWKVDDIFELYDFNCISTAWNVCLSAVARKRSLFDDKAEDIQQLTLVIKQDINTLNRQIGQLQEVSCGVIYIICVCSDAVQWGMGISSGL